MNEDLSVEHPDLEEYFDATAGVLSDRIRAHVESCPRCARELDFLVELRERARTLPREIAPAVDLWPGIAARIAGSPQRFGVPPAPPVRLERTRDGRILPGWRWLAAAAVVVMVIAGGGLLNLLGGFGSAGESPIATAPDRSSGRPAPGLAAFASTEQEYRTTVEMLEAELAARRDQLDPATIDVVERNLAIIDTAIAESRRALAADPSSVDLPLLLSDVYRQKLELLQQAVRISARS